MSKYPKFQGRLRFRVLGYLHYTFPKLGVIKQAYYRVGRGGSL